MADPENACKSLSPITVSDDEKTPASGTSPIVVVKFGGCLPITKIKYAQTAGAKMVIFIADENIENLEAYKPIGRGHSTPTPEPQPAFNSLGQLIKIQIPTVMISREDGEVLTKFLTSDKPSAKQVSFSAKFNMVSTKCSLFVNRV